MCTWSLVVGPGRPHAAAGLLAADGAARALGAARAVAGRRAGGSPALAGLQQLQAGGAGRGPAVQDAGGGGRRRCGGRDGCAGGQGGLGLPVEGGRPHFRCQTARRSPAAYRTLLPCRARRAATRTWRRRQQGGRAGGADCQRLTAARPAEKGGRPGPAVPAAAHLPPQLGRPGHALARAPVQGPGRGLAGGAGAPGPGRRWRQRRQRSRQQGSARRDARRHAQLPALGGELCHTLGRERHEGCPAHAPWAPAERAPASSQPPLQHAAPRVIAVAGALRANTHTPLPTPPAVACSKGHGASAVVLATHTQLRLPTKPSPAKYRAKRSTRPVAFAEREVQAALCADLQDRLGGRGAALHALQLPGRHRHLPAQVRRRAAWGERGAACSQLACSQSACKPCWLGCWLSRSCWRLGWTVCDDASCSALNLRAPPLPASGPAGHSAPGITFPPSPLPGPCPGWTSCRTARPR